MENQQKLPLKQRVITGFIMAVIGTLIVTFINYLRDMPFNSLYATISFFLFWIFGIFMAKRKPNNKNKNLD
ncbi:MAG TPA: hypothetical protein EYO76_09155 [Flavobacteriaceae bacterium]|nr:hypothetical protein [Flavobacteriaceae bacterium]